MANKVRIELNHASIAKLLKSAEVQQDLRRRGEAIAHAAGDGVEVDATVGRTRARVTVRTATPDARRREATSRALTKAIDAGRG